jgi:RNA polymerase sigma-70 factor (ECF subfamily)
MALSRDRAVAEDLVQETYVRALAAHRRAEPDQNLRGWLFTILHNIWLNQVRGRRLLPIDETSRPAAVVWLKPPADPEVELERGRLREALRRAIAALPDGYRETVVLRFIEGFSYQEIASIMGCPIGTVMSRLARGRALLRRLLTLAPPRSREAG